MCFWCKTISFSDSGPGLVIQMVVLNSVVTWIVLSYNSFDPIEILPCLYRTLGPAEAVGHSDG